ncbi:MAG: RluA family pseudouridine synthase [Synergistales bacterium]|nr:RluA family pseudouridine synthase [Synergistales bacterium]
MKVSGHHSGRRLDKYIRFLWPNIPLSALMKHIRKGTVRVNGSKVPCSERLEEGDLVTVPWAAPSMPCDKEPGHRDELDLIYRDRNIAIINKPSGLLSQPSTKGEDSVITRFWKCFGSPFEDFRPSLANRLDRNTSGALLVAMNGMALRDLNSAIREGHVKKRYLAVVCGKIDLKGRIAAPLMKDSSTNLVTVDPGGKPSVTLFTRLFSSHDLSLVEVDLVTGRPHQARVHLSYAGHPVLGDLKYGFSRMNDLWRSRGVRRPLLHASGVGFSDPRGVISYLSGNTFFASLPVDFTSILEAMNWYYSVPANPEIK